MSNIRTRFAPSPTGYMHIGNLRTALYSYLYAKRNNGKLILRIEDTDQGRLVEGATEVIYNTLRETGIFYDEGPDVGGQYGPYIQSQRKKDYLEKAQQLVAGGHAYYCFCTEERLASLVDDNGNRKYDKHCLSLSAEEVSQRIASGEKYVIRQNMPTTGSSTYTDLVYGDITVDNDQLEDQILIKSDGMPTYNFANVIDDHAMDINCVMRGIEYLTSTPKYNYLYDAFGWEKPIYIHMPPIMKDATHKLSKRNGDANYADLIAKGYLRDAIINYIALLGWSPKDDTEKMSYQQLIDKFDVNGINKSPSIFDPVKLDWLNSLYIKEMSTEQFASYARQFVDDSLLGQFDYDKMFALVHNRIDRFDQINDMLSFLVKFNPDNELYYNKKQKTDKQTSYQVMPHIIDSLQQLEQWDNQHIYDALVELAGKLELKNGKILWPARIAITAMSATAGGASEIADILGKSATLDRLQQSLAVLTTELD